MYRQGGRPSVGEAVATMLSGLEGKNLADKGKRTDAIRDLGAALPVLNRAMRAQKRYDRETAHNMRKLAAALIDNGMLDGLSNFEVKRILKTLDDSIGREDISKQANALMGIMAENFLRNSKGVFDELLQRVKIILPAGSNPACPKGSNSRDFSTLVYFITFSVRASGLKISNLQRRTLCFG